jgi:hypothetical protein
LTPTSHIIYFDATTGTMKLGAWTTLGGAVNNSNQLFFKLGGVVGFTNTVAAEGTPWPGADAVKFNPGTGTPVYTTYGNIPRWNGTSTADGYISSTSYHTKDNVLAGRGDPCKLVGLTVAQIHAGPSDNGKYRLPTDAENAAYSSPTLVAGAGWVSGTTPTAGIYTGNIGTSFLPASGERHSTGVTSEVGADGHYWSSCAVNSGNGYYLWFYDKVIDPSYINSAANGNAVRCVPQ